MANEIQLAYGVTGRTLYAVVRSATAAVWNGAAFETYSGANWATYAVAMAEQGTSGYYAGNFPAVAAGVYPIEVRDRSGGAPATTDPLAGSGGVEWGGSAVVPLSSRLAPTVADRTLDVTSTGAAGIDWGNVENQTATVSLVDTSVANAATVDEVLTLSVGERLEIGIAVWGTLSRTLTNGDNIVLAKGVGVTGFNDLSAAQVNEQVLDVLTVDTFAEPTGVPGATVALSEKIGRVYQALRNQLTVTATAKTFYSDGAAALWKKVLSDDGTTYQEAEAAAP